MIYSTMFLSSSSDPSVIGFSCRSGGQKVTKVLISGSNGMGVVGPITAEAIFVTSGTFSEELTVSELFNLAPLTDTQKDAITNQQAGSMIFNTISGTVNVYDGNSWRELAYI